MSLKQFKDKYNLIDGIVVSSKEFNLTSKNTHFPILIGIYAKNNKEMTYEFIKSFQFSVYNFDYRFSLN